MNPPSTVPVNPDSIIDVNRWQPLQYTDATGSVVIQKYLGVFWGKVKPFALSSGDQFRGRVATFGPFRVSDAEFLTQAEALVDCGAWISAQLDRQTASRVAPAMLAKKPVKPTAGVSAEPSRS